jgi:hypothetical protein
MHHFMAQRAGAYFAVTAQTRASEQIVLLGAREMEKAQRQLAAAVGDAHEQAAPPPERNVGYRDHAFDYGALTGPQGAKWCQSRTVFVALRQQKQKIQRPTDAQPEQAFLSGRPDPPQ